MTFKRLPRVPLLRTLILFTAVSALNLSLPAQTASDPKPPPVASPTDTTIESRAAQALREFYADPPSGQSTSTSSQTQPAPTPAQAPAPPPPIPIQPTEVSPVVERDVPAPAAIESTAPAPPLEPLSPPVVSSEEPVESPAVSPVETVVPAPAAVEMTAPAPPLEPVPPPAQPLQPRPADPIPAPPVSPPAMSVEERAAEALEHFYADPRRVKSSFPPPQFEPWPEPPPPLRPFPEPVQPLPTPPPVMPEAAEGRQLFSFRAENMDLKSALAVFARANELNIVPDHDVIGQVTLDVVDLSLERIMQALLEAHDFTWTVEDGLIRVRTTETRTFVVDYLRLRREGSGMSLVTLSSSSQGGGGGGRGGGGGGGGMSGGGGGMSGGGAGGSMSGSLMNLTLENPIEFWKELEEQLQRLLSPRGRERIAVNQTAGVIQVTDHPSALRKVEDYLGRMNESVSRQVDIEAKLYDVVLSDQFQFGIDWEHVVTYMGGQMFFQGTPTVVNPAGGFPLKLSSLSAGFANENTAIVLTALQEQGDVRVISQPRLRTLNNQTAIMKVGQDVPFWTSFTVTDSSAGGQTTTSGDVPTTITVGTVLALTPQISTNGWISIDISPAAATG
jgi:hypothetical protein